jgi:hypothetical protein
MVELRNLGGDLHGMVVRQADHRGAEGQVFGARHEASHEHQRRGNRLGRRREMLTKP